MKIGILTYHFVPNIGSILQARCVYQLVQQLVPHASVEMIDLRPPELISYRKSVLRWGDRKVRACRKIEFAKQQKFLRSSCQMSKPILAETLEEQSEELLKLGYDLVVVGSDTVFQLNGYKGRTIAGSLPPNIYFLPGLKVKKISFAASFDPFDDCEDSQRFLEIVSPALNDFDYHLARDEVGHSILKKAGVGDNQLSLVADPTLTHCLSDLLGPLQRKRHSGGRIGIQVTDPSLTTSLVDGAAIAGRSEAWIDFSATTPSLIACLVKGWPSAQITRMAEINAFVTDRFHGSILGFYYTDGPVIGVEKASVYPNNNSKVRQLFASLGLEDYVVRVEADDHDSAVRDVLSTMKRWRSDPPDVADCLEKLRVDSFEQTKLAFDRVVGA